MAGQMDLRRLLSSFCPLNLSRPVRGNGKHAVCGSWVWLATTDCGQTGGALCTTYFKSSDITLKTAIIELLESTRYNYPKHITVIDCLVTISLPTLTLHHGNGSLAAGRCQALGLLSTSWKVLTQLLVRVFVFILSVFIWCGGAATGNVPTARDKWSLLFFFSCVTPSCAHRCSRIASLSFTKIRLIARQPWALIERIQQKAEIDGWELRNPMSDCRWRFLSTASLCCNTTLGQITPS